MELRLIEVASLKNLANTFQNKDLPIKVAFKLNKLLIAIENHFSFYRLKLNEIIEKYSEKNEEGKPLLTDDGLGYKIVPECQIECNSKIQELSNLIVEVPENIKFTLDELDGISLNIQDMYLFSKFIEDEEAQE